MASAEDKAPARRFRFGDLTFDPGRHGIWRGDQLVPLSKLTFEFLRALVEDAPDVVSHEELAERTWGPRRVVTPENLTKRVMLVRQALGDSAEQPRYIERVRGQGYRLIPAVEELEAAPDPAAAEAQPALELPPPVTPARTVSSYARAALVISAAVVVIVAAGWIGYASIDRPNPRAHNRSIAVLPFENRSVTEEDAGFFAQGIHDDLITRLAAIDDLKVTPRSSVIEYHAQQPRSPRQLADELGVGVVVDGSVQRAGSQVRVNVHLIDARTEEMVWGGSYDEELTAENVFAIQKEIAISIAAELEAKLTPEEATRLSRAPTQDIRALDLYMSGRDYERPPFAYWGMAALQYQRAVEKDPAFALAHARLSLASLLAYYNIDGDRERVAAAKAAAEEAVRLEPDLPLGHVAMAFYLISEEGDLARAQAELEAASPTGGDEPQFFIVRSLINERLGNREQAAADRAAALALNPRDPTMMLDIGIWHSRVRNHDEAQRLVDRALDIRPDFVAAAMFEAELAMLRDADVGPVKKLSMHEFAGDPGRRARLRDLKWLAALYQKDYPAAVRILDHHAVGQGEDEAFEQRRRESLPFLLSMASTLRLAGDVDGANQLYQQGLARTEHDAPPWRMWRAAFLAGCGQSAEAVTIGRQLLSENRADGPFANIMRLWLVREVFAPGGAHQLAIEVLDEYLSRPGSWSIEGLLPDPRFDAFRADPAFKALIAKHRRT